MIENRLCPKCGTELLLDAVQGLCPMCLLDAGIESEVENRAKAQASPVLTPSQAFSPTTLQPNECSVPDLDHLARQFPQLDNFEHLGRGGMGVVYKARQKQLNRLVAVKVLPPSVGNDPAFAERFTREAQSLARLNHPNIVQVYDFGQTEEFFYIVMEFIDGVNLRCLMRDGNLKSEDVLKIVPQICEALQFAHDEGIVHRDIKPENILIDKKGRVKIADFGLAKLLGQSTDDLSLTGTGQVMGTMGYMAPEQMRQSHTVDHRADIYSLGVVFYEMLTGQLPFGRFQPPSKKVQVDIRLDEVVLRSLESEPGRRYQHASEVKTDVETISRVAVAMQPDSAPTAFAPMADDLDEARRREELASRTPAWVELSALVIFTIAWCFLEAMWNWRHPGMAIGIAVMAACTYGVVQWKLQYLPKLRNELSRQSRVRRVITLACSFVVFLLAICCVEAFNLNMRNWVAGGWREDWIITEARTVASGQAFLLNKLESLRSDQAAEFETYPIGGKTSGMGFLLGAALIAFWGVLLLISSIQIVIDTLLYRYTWKCSYGPSLSLTSLLLIGLLLANFCRSVSLEKNSLTFGGTHVSASFPTQDIRGRMTSAQLESLIADWTDANAYVSGQQYSWQIKKQPGYDVGRIRIVVLRPASPFDAWRIDWGGPAWRPLPPLILTCMSTDNPAESLVSVNAGMITKNSRETQTWPAVLDSLDASIRSGSAVVSNVAQLSKATTTDLLTAFFCSGLLLAIGTVAAWKWRQIPAMVQDSTQNKNRHTPQPESDHHRLEWPATALLMTGILDCVTALLLLCAAGAHMLMDTKLHYFTNAVSWSMLLLSLVIGIVTILGGLKMKQRESRPFVLAAAFLTMVPRFPVTWVFGLASGIWNVIVLSDPKVKAVFPRAKRHRSVEDQVRMPAIGLMLAGALHILFVVSFESELLPTPKLSGPTQFLIVLLAAVLGVQITLGGTKMLRIQSEDWAMKASILALMPIGPGWLLGLPMGIWSLIVLSRPEVKTAFQRVANRNHSD